MTEKQQYVEALKKVLKRYIEDGSDALGKKSKPKSKFTDKKSVFDRVVTPKKKHKKEIDDILEQI